MKRHTPPNRMKPGDAVRIFTRDGGCIAPLLGGSFLDCWGRLTIEHVKAELCMGVRGTQAVTLCQGHTEDGRKAGYQWNTDRRNRELVRGYLASVETAQT